jgi:putative ABC transport system substrate-binding protein
LYLERLKEVVLQPARVTVLWDPTTGPVRREAAQVAAHATAIVLHTPMCREAAEFTSAFLAATRRHPEALLVFGSPIIRRKSKRIVDLAAQRRSPAIAPCRDFAEAGGLMAYGAARLERYRRCGVQVGKILQGAKSGDLPVKRPTTFELVTNLKTAKALGLTIPPTLLASCMSR